MPPDSGPSPPAKRDGRLTRDTAKALGKKGGEAKAAKNKLMNGLGILGLAKDATFRPYMEAAEAYREAIVRGLTARFGVVDAIASTLIASASLQLAQARWTAEKAAGQFAFDPGDPESFFVVSGDPATAVRSSKLAIAAHASLRAAIEYLRELEGEKPAAPPGGQKTLEQALE